MKVNLAYGQGHLAIDLPEERTTIIEPSHTPGLADERAAVRAALDRPIAKGSLHRLADRMPPPGDPWAEALGPAVRLDLGRFLVLGLEFQLAADILRTAVSPSFTELAQLAAIAAIRTALNFFLGMEIKNERDLVRTDQAAARPHSGSDEHS